MRNMIFRKKIGTAGDFFEKNIAEALPVFLLFLCYMIGFFIGRAIAGNAAPEKYSAPVTTFFSLPADKTALWLFLFYLFYTLCDALAGLSVFGFIGIPVLTASYGVICGAAIKMIYAVYVGKNAIVPAAAVLPASAFFGASFLLSGKHAALYSFDIYSVFLKRSVKSAENLRQYFIIHAFTFFSGIIASLFSALLLFLFR